jgi:ferredoxin
MSRAARQMAMAAHGARPDTAVAIVFHRRRDEPKCRLIASPISSLKIPDCGRKEMKIRIEKAACVGNARCAAISEDLFPLDDEGYIAIEGFDVDDALTQLAKRGARACPERIISVVEDNGSISWPPQKAK